MNIEDLENDIEEFRELNEIEFANSLENLKNIFLYDRNKELFIKEKNIHIEKFPEFKFPNCFDEEQLD